MAAESPEPWQVRSGWVAVRCLFVIDPNARPRAYEERITVWRADTATDALRYAENEAREYAAAIGADFCGLLQAFSLFDEIADGSEVFSLIRDSELDPDDYIDRYFDTGREHDNRQPRSD